MPVISEQDRRALSELLERQLKDEVTVVLFTQRPLGLYVPGQQDCQSCRETQSLLQELASLSGKIKLEVHDRREDEEPFHQYSIEMVPTIVLKSSKTGGDGVRFVGMPSGYEFSVLIGDITDLSSGDFRLSPETEEALSKIDQPLHLRVFVTPT